MAEDPLHDIIETVRARLKTELDTQLQTASTRHEQALEEQRSRIEAEAERRWAPQLEAARAELDQQATAAAAARAALDDLQELLAREEALAASRAVNARPGTGAPGPGPADRDRVRLVDRLRSIDAATSVSTTLAALVQAASLDGSRAAVYVANGTRLEQVDVNGQPSPGASFFDLTADHSTARESIVVDAFRRRDAVRRDGEGCAVPMLLDGTPVAVLYGETDPAADGTTGWVESFEALARHGAARLGYLTALRTAQARQWLAAAPAATSSSGNDTNTPGDEIASARRYARLVVSEIKLYNEKSVEEGRSQRDLLTRLGPEIDRARRLFEERVPVSVPGRSDYFQQELIQTLAGGDPSLLG